MSVGSSAMMIVMGSGVKIKGYHEAKRVKAGEFQFKYPRGVKEYLY